MALKNLVKQTKEPLKASASGEDFKFVELSPKQEKQLEKEGKTYFEAHEDDVEVTLEEFQTQYRTWKQVSMAGDDIELVEFLDLGGMYVGEITFAIMESIKAKHPEYFEAVKRMEKENSGKYLEMVESMKSMTKE